MPSINWTDELVTDALKRDPGPPYESVQHVTAAMFDNYTAQVRSILLDLCTRVEPHGPCHASHVSLHRTSLSLR